MHQTRRLAFYGTLPINLVLLVWIWIGRTLFGSGGWYILILLGTVIPVLALALTITTILAILQHQPAAMGRLTTAQFWALTAVWFSMFGFGFFLVDVGDAPASASSAFSTITEREYIVASTEMSYLFLLAIVGSWVTLLVLLVVGMRGRAVRRAADQPGQQGWAYPYVQQGWAHPPSAYPGQAYPAQAHPAQAYPGQAYPAQAYPGQAYPGQAYPAQAYHAPPLGLV